MDWQPRISSKGSRRIRGLLAASAAAWAFATSATNASQSNASAGTPTAAVTMAPRAFLDSYCVTCHNARRLTAGLALDTIDVADVGRSAAIWEKVVKKLESGSMPPAGARRPDEQIERSFLSYLV